MSIYKKYGLDNTKVKDGVVLDYGDTRIRIVRSGITNPDYIKLTEKLSRKHRLSLKKNDNNYDIVIPMTKELHASAVIKDWQTLNAKSGKWEKGIASPDGQILLPVTVQNILKIFDILPDLYEDIVEQAATLDNFKQNEMENDTKNL